MIYHVASIRMIAKRFCNKSMNIEMFFCISYGQLYLMVSCTSASSFKNVSCFCIPDSSNITNFIHAFINLLPAFHTFLLIKNTPRRECLVQYRLYRLTFA